MVSFACCLQSLKTQLSREIEIVGAVITTEWTKLMFEQNFTKLELTLTLIHRSTKQHSHVKYSNCSTEALGSTDL